jgi:hypothetical protein
MIDAAGGDGTTTGAAGGFGWRARRERAACSAMECMNENDGGIVDQHSREGSIVLDVVGSRRAAASSGEGRAALCWLRRVLSERVPHGRDGRTVEAA